MVLAIAEATWFGLAAAFSSIAGIVLATLSHKQGRKAAEREAAAKTHDQLIEARREAEKLSEELHKLKMERSDDQGQG